VDALRQVHAALVPGGLVIDTQPVSAQPSIETEGAGLGTLDMREWAQTIATVDERIDNAIRAGLFALEEERRFIVTDRYDDGADLAGETREWQGTHIDDSLAQQLSREQRPVLLHQEIRLRLLRAL
jgi:hypothetical protein